MQATDAVRFQDLCLAALEFASDTLVAGGHFVCKYYQGAESKDLEKKLKKMFEKVYREKPQSSRTVSCEPSARVADPLGSIVRRIRKNSTSWPCGGKPRSLLRTLRVLHKPRLIQESPGLFSAAQQSPPWPRSPGAQPAESRVN